MTDINKTVIPVPTDLPPGSRPAWRALTGLVDELRRANNKLARAVANLSGDQTRAFTAIQTQSAQIVDQETAIASVQDSYEPSEPPLVPSAPILTTGVSTVTITWDGMLMEVPGQEYDEAGNPVGTPGSPVPVATSENVGFRYVYAERSPTGIVGDPGDDEFVGDWERIGQPLNEAGRIIVRETMGDTLYYRLVTVNYSGVESGGSDVESIVVVGVDAPDIEADAVTANSIQAGAIDGMIITGALIQTDAAVDAGIKLTGDDFVAYDASGNQTVHIDGNTGQVEFVGADVVDSNVSGTFTSGDQFSQLLVSSNSITAFDTTIDELTMAFRRPLEVYGNSGYLKHVVTRNDVAGTADAELSLYPAVKLPPGVDSYSPGDSTRFVMENNYPAGGPLTSTAYLRANLIHLHSMDALGEIRIQAPDINIIGDVNIDGTLTYTQVWGLADTTLGPWSMPSTVSTVPLGSTADVLDGFTSFTSNQFTVAQEGWYDVQGTCEMTPGSAGLGTGILLTYVQVNGATFGPSVSRIWPQTNSNTSVSFGGKAYLAAGDTVRLAAARSSGLTGATMERATLSVLLVK